MGELAAAVDLCNDDGTLASRAIGWSRRPVHRCNLSGRRKKRWDYWFVTDERYCLVLLVADLDYLRLGVASLLDITTGKRIDRVAPSLSRCPLPETVGGGTISFSALGLTLEIAPTRLAVQSRGLSAEIALDDPGDTLSVVIPKNAREFQFTCKQVGRGARGKIVAGEREIVFDRAWAGLDFGRGTWPARTRWNWAGAAGGNVAFNLGARWTDGTGATENGLFLDGKLHKIEDDVQFEGDRILGPGVDLRFTPQARQKVGVPPILGLDWRCGRFEGRILDTRVDNLFGWNEAVDILW